MLTSIIILVHSFSLATAFEGPLQVKNQFPIFLPINQPYLEQATLESSFSVSLSHSSVYLMEDSTRWSVHLDMEVTELNFRYRKNVPGLFEIGLDLPVLRATSGFMTNRWHGITRPSGSPTTGEAKGHITNFSMTYERTVRLSLKV